jgi:hypothetical protein
MKKYLLLLTAAVALLTVSSTALADPAYESLAINGTTTPSTIIDVKQKQTIAILNFIDANTATQSSLSVTIGSVTTKTLTATSSTAQEIFKDLVVTGPATVTVTVATGQTTYLSLHKLSN